MSVTEGAKAPAFSMPTDGGGKVALKDLKGRQVVLYFYPKDSTPGCTKEACAFRDLMPDFSGVDAEIIDVRTLAPLDVDTLVNSVKKTGRCLIAHEATRFGGYGAELAARIQKDCFWHLEAPISRVAGWDTPYPHAFEWQYFPGKKRLMAAIRNLMEVE